MSQRSSFRGSSHLKLSGTVLPEDLEKNLITVYKESKNHEPLLIDFFDADYIDITTLVNCISLLVMRQEQGLKSFIGFPRDRRLRDFLKVWRFTDAVKNATGVLFEEILLTEDYHYLSEKQNTYSGIGNGIDALEYDPDWNGDIGGKRNFFEFTSFMHNAAAESYSDGPLFSAPRTESKRWTGTLVKKVLEKHLSGESPRDEIARVIVYEAMSNAVRHPKARIIETVSHFARKDKTISRHEKPERSDQVKKKVEGSLRLCVWDDGESIAKTLLSPLKAGRSVRAFQFPAYMCDRIFVQLRDFDKTKKEQFIVDQCENPSAESMEAVVLLSSLYPGISRTAADIAPEVEPFDQQPSTTDTKAWLDWAPGMGLYSLARTALDQYQGNLFIRSGKYRLSIEMAHDTYRVQHSARYKCKITEYPEILPEFRGNLVTITLPIKA